METVERLHPKQIEILRRMSPEEKFAVADALEATAKEVKRGFLKHKHPDWTSDQIEAEVKRIFFYGHT